MERTKFDDTQAQEIASEAISNQLSELSELQLTFVGGGIADVVL